MNDREKIARAICEAQGRDPDGFDTSFYCDANNRPLPCWQGYNEEADAVLAALGLGEGGENQVVPREPDAKMIGAWYQCKNGFHFPEDPPPSDTSDYAAYRAMLSARPQAGEAG